MEHSPRNDSPFIIDPRDCAPQEFLRRAAAAGVSERPARRWLHRVMNEESLEPGTLRSAGILPRRAEQHFGPLPRLRLERISASAVDGFQKLLFRTHDDLPVETVLIPLHKPGAVSICLSSQVGCVMRCVFCATGRMPQRRSLQRWEIIDQFLQARAAVRRQSRRVTGAVFMGMGEPFLNYERVLDAAELLRFPVKGAIGAEKITISTVGLVDEIRRYTREERPFRLSISLGAATDAQRARLVPVAARAPVEQVMAAAREHAAARRERVMLAYVCIKGENVSPEDARALADLVGTTPVRLDLIDVTDPTGRYLPPSAEELKEFRDLLSRYLGQPVVRRYSGGADIQAACGTLAGAEL